MNIHQTKTDRSPEAVARRRRATDEARAAIARQGYTYDSVLEEATAAYVAGDITRDEYKARLTPPARSA